jgi:ribosomal protein S27AE
LQSNWQIRTTDFKVSPLLGEVSVSTPKERFFLACKKTLAVWGLALLCVFVPVFHFVLVPAFLLTGLVMGWLSFKKDFHVKNGKFKCPQCGDDQSLGEYWFSSDQRTRCGKCSCQLVIGSS